MTFPRHTMRIALIAACLLPAAWIQAADYPTKSIRLIVPFVAGGGTDVLARIISPRLVELLGQQVVVDNRGGAAITDVLGGHTDVTFVVPGSVNHHIQAGTLVPLGVTGSRPSRALPTVPTFASVGLPAVDPGSFRFLAAPAALSPAIRNKLIAALRTAMETPLVQTRLAEGGYEPAFIPHPEARGYIDAEMRKWRQAVKDAGVKLN